MRFEIQTPEPPDYTCIDKDGNIIGTLTYSITNNRYVFAAKGVIYKLAEIYAIYKKCRDLNNKITDSKRNADD